VKWLADENLDNAIVRGLLRRSYGFDLVRAQDVPEISGEADTVMLEWATRNGRVVLTHDVSTMIPAMREQLIVSRCAPIVFVPDSLAVGQAIEDVLLLDGCAVEDDWTSGVIYLPLR
jgi:hypothetical protein